jgi:hypothetical protein
MSSILRGGEEVELDRGGLETRHPPSTGMIGSNRWHRLPDAGRRAGRGADRLDSQLGALSPPRQGCPERVHAPHNVCDAFLERCAGDVLDFHGRRFGLGA